MNHNETENKMTTHQTHVVTYRNEQHAYCMCGWVDIWRPNDGSAYGMAAAHKHQHEQGEA